MTERLTEEWYDDMEQFDRYAPKSPNIEINCGGDDFQDIIDKLAEYEIAEEEGRLVVLPVGIGDEVYIIEKCQNIPERLDGTLYDSDGGTGTATGYYCPYEANCPFDDDDFTICDDYKEKLAVFKDYVDEIHIRENEISIFAENTCQYCSFGKTMFLTREEAEKALKEMEEK